MSNLSPLMAALQPLFGSKANELAFTTGFRSRPSPLGGAELAFALVGGWLRLSNPQASRSELAQLSGVSKQALDQSLGEKAACFLAQLLEWCIAQRIGAAQPTTAELLARFKAVYVMGGIARLSACHPPLKTSGRVMVKRGAAATVRLVSSCTWPSTWWAGSC